MRRTTLTRILSRVQLTAPPPHLDLPCWIWTGTTDRGYGSIEVRGRTIRVHRLIWELTISDIPPGVQVLHHCDRPGCVRPSHLHLGTPRDNNRDMDNRGRRARGTRSGTAILTEDLVLEARRRYAAGGTTVTDIATDLGVNRGTLNIAIRGGSWAHLPGVIGHRTRDPKAFAAHFWANVKTSTDDACWLWTGPITAKGACQVRKNGKHVPAHRIAFLLATGRPSDPNAKRRCRNARCCNPSHLQSE